MYVYVCNYTWYVHVKYKFLSICEYMWVYVSIWQYMWVYVSIYEYMLVYVSICQYMCVYDSICKYMWVYVNICEYMWVYVSICQYMWVYVSICEYISVYVLVKQHARKRSGPIWNNYTVNLVPWREPWYNSVMQPLNYLSSLLRTTCCMLVQRNETKFMGDKLLILAFTYCSLRDVVSNSNHKGSNYKENNKE
jgi:hypothetical protein